MIQMLRTYSALFVSGNAERVGHFLWVGRVEGAERPSRSGAVRQYCKLLKRIDCWSSKEMMAKDFIPFRFFLQEWASLGY